MLSFLKTTLSVGLKPTTIGFLALFVGLCWAFVPVPSKADESKPSCCAGGCVDLTGAGPLPMPPASSLSMERLEERLHLPGIPLEYIFHPGVTRHIEQ